MHVEVHVLSTEVPRQATQLGRWIFFHEPATPKVSMVLS